MKACLVSQLHEVVRLGEVVLDGSLLGLPQLLVALPLELPWVDALVQDRLQDPAARELLDLLLQACHDVHRLGARIHRGVRGARCARLEAEEDPSALLEGTSLAFGRGKCFGIVWTFRPYSCGTRQRACTLPPRPGSCFAGTPPHTGRMSYTAGNYSGNPSK